MESTLEGKTNGEKSEKSEKADEIKINNSEEKMNHIINSTKNPKVICDKENHSPNNAIDNNKVSCESKIDSDEPRHPDEPTKLQPTSFAAGLFRNFTGILFVQF